MSSTVLRLMAGLAMAACAAGATAQSCFSIPTHYSAATQGFAEGAHDLPNLLSGDPALRYPANRLPKYESYIGANFTTLRVTAAEACEWAQQMQTLTGYPVYFRKPTSYSNFTTAKAALSSNINAFQVLPNLIVGNNLVTVIVPPGWLAEAGRGRYAVIASASQTMKAAIQSDASTIVPAIASAMSTNADNRAITLLWNGRGELGSLIADQEALWDLGMSVIQKADVFGGDRGRLFLHGTGRGALGVLRYAAQGSARAVFVAMPPTAMDELVEMSNATVPQLYDTAESILGFNRAWPSGWTYPSPPGHAELAGMSRAQAQLHILTGMSDPAKVRASGLSPRTGLARMAYAGTNVFLQVGSHDSNVPWLDQFRYLKALEASGVPYDAMVNYLGGHHHDVPVMRRKMAHALVQMNQRLPMISTPGTFRRVRGQFGYALGGASDLFTVELPKMLSPSITGSINATGLRGTQFRIAYTAPGRPQQVVEDTIGDDGTRFAALALPVGKTSIDEIRFRLPGQALWRCKVMDHGSTTNPDRTITMMSFDPGISGRQVSTDLSRRIVGASAEYAHVCQSEPTSAPGRCAGVSWGFVQSPVNDGSDACTQQ